MATIVTLLKIIDNYDQASRNIAKTADSVGQLEKHANSATNMLSKVGPALAGAFTATAIIGAGKQVLDFADHVSNLSQKLGISTDAVQKFELAFAPAGISIDAVAAASLKLSKNLVGGDQSTLSALMKLGVSVADLKKMAPEQQFLTVADAVGKIQNPTEKAYAAMTVFGKGGAELLAGLTGHLKETTDGFDRMGLIISGETIKAADDFGDQLGLMSRQLLGIVATVVGPLLPAISALGNLLMWVGASVIKPVLVASVQLVSLALGGLWISLSTLLAKLADLATKIPLLGKHLGFAAGASQWLKESAAATAKGLASMLTQTDGTGTAAAKATPPILGLGTATKDAESAARKAAAALEKIIARIHEIEGSNPSFKIVALADALKEIGGTVGNAADDVLVTLSRMSIRSATDVDVLRGSVEGLQRHGRFLSAAMVDVNAQIGVLPNVTTVATQALDNARVAAEAFGGSLKKNLLATLQGLPGALAAAFTGGGGLSGAIRAFAAQLAGDFVAALNAGIKKALAAGGSAWNAITGKAAAATGAVAGLGAAMSGASGKAAAASVAMAGVSVAAGALGAGATISGAAALGAATAGVGLAAVGAYFAIKKLLSDPEKKINPLREAFVRAAGGLAALSARAVEATGSLRLVQDLLAAKNPADYQRAVEALDGAFQRLTTAVEKYGLTLKDLADPARVNQGMANTARDLQADFDLLLGAGYKTDSVIKGMSGSINTFLADALATGTKVPIGLQPMIEKMIRMGLITEDNARKMLGLADTSMPSLADITDAADRYGIKLDSLGVKVKRLQITDEANQMIKDWDILSTAADDFGVLLDPMRGKVQDLVDRAVKYGATLPEAMKPMLRAFVDAGKLVDANGDKLTDLSSLHFAKDLTQMFDELIGKLDDLIDTIQNGVGGALDKLPKTKTVDVDVNWKVPVLPTYLVRDDDTGRAHRGAMVTASGLQRFHAGTAKVLPFIRAHTGLAVTETPTIVQVEDGKAGEQQQIVGPAALKALTLLVRKQAA